MQVMEQNHTDPSVLPVYDVKNWPKTMEMVVQYAEGFRAQDGSRLSYIMRPSLFAPAATSDPTYGAVGSIYGASSFNSDISNWNVSAVTNMQYMFFAASSFNSDISNWNIAQVTEMKQMFKGARGFHQNLCPWGSKLPSNFDYASHATVMFFGSGCANQDDPTGSTGPWCDVTTCTP
jgi:surface protein